MNISVCITTLNEEDSIADLLTAILSGSKKPNEIVIVDAGSTDKTIDIIRHFQKKDSRIKLLIEKGVSRSKGRNISVEISKSEIIAMTDAGCVPNNKWLERITSPFKYNVDVVAGFYKMKTSNNFEKVESYFLGVTPKRFNVNFLPSTRSIAFNKSIWEKVGGFPENLSGAAEDTVFNYKLLKSRARFSRVKNAVVEWGIPKTLGEFISKVFYYAKGDGETKIFNFPTKSYTSHNVKSVLVLLRYLFMTLFLIYSIYKNLSLAYFFVFIFVYLSWSFGKIFHEFEEVKIAIWGPIFQMASDISVMSGFLVGILKIK